MKNYPNQASSFPRIRATLATIADMNASGMDVTSDDVLGYELARRGHYTFRHLDAATATASQIEARIASERLKPTGNQGAQTNARELRRTMQDMGWLDVAAGVTREGVALLASAEGSVAEQALLVEGLLHIQATDPAGNSHHPVVTMLRLLAIHPSLARAGLELALEPLNDSQSEFDRVAAMYDLPAPARQSALGISDAQRANAVKIFPSLAEQAGLVVRTDREYSLSSDGWAVLGATPSQAASRISLRRGRRTTVGRVVNSSTAGHHGPSAPPRTLSPEEQRRAAERLAERTSAHQATVRQLSGLIGDVGGTQFEDPFSYDLLWLPHAVHLPAFLFEVKSITHSTDAYARVRDAVGQLHYYGHFSVRPPVVGGRDLRKILVVNAPIPQDLVDYATEQGIAVVLLPLGGTAIALNPAAEANLRLLP